MTLVSVLMPMRNARPYVPAALESILIQTGAELEVIVIDDGSTDGSGDAVKGVGDARVRLLPGPCRGISAALNTALTAARGDIVMRCDADDLYAPGRVAWQVGWLQEHPEFGAVCARFTTMTPKGQPVSELRCGGDTAEEITNELRDGVPRTSLCTFAVRTELLRQLGGCRPFFATAEDLDLQFRIGSIARVWFEPRSCYFYRLHDGSITHTQGNTLKDFYERTAREFAAQRRSGRPDDLELGRPPVVPAAGQGDRFTSADHLQGMMITESWNEHAAGHRLRALKMGMRACLARPQRLAGWKNLLALLYKRPDNGAR